MTAAEDQIREGRLYKYTPKMFSSKIISAYEIFQCIYVDNGAFPFGTRVSLPKGMGLVYIHFTQFGLKMHIGRNGDEPKMECVFFPSPPIRQTAPEAGNWGH